MNIIAMLKNESARSARMREGLAATFCGLSEDEAVGWAGALDVD